MKLTRRGLFRSFGAVAGAAIVGRMAGKSEDRSEPSHARDVDPAPYFPVQALGVYTYGTTTSSTSADFTWTITNITLR